MNAGWLCAATRHTECSPARGAVPSASPIDLAPGALLKTCHAIFLIAAGGCAAPGGSAPAPCTDAWERFIEEKVPTGDGRGHGPDVGSAEWQSVVEFRLGIRGEPGVPARDTAAWCRHIDRIVRGSAAAPVGGGETANACEPSFSGDGGLANDVVATYFETEGPARLPEPADSVSLMYAAPSASGSKCNGRIETLRAHHGGARAEWDYGASVMRGEVNR